MGEQTVEAPPFVIDIALLITPDGAPDTDHDGIPNDTDPDDDNDGVPDIEDAFPLEPEEWEDKLSDLIEAIHEDYKKSSVFLELVK